ncbi:TIGR04282 family arsenosugar biosynthesis glycosyltransferase [Yinghuangia sp. YIM S09857]|uniref:TIGR04282 family arsenosugar biosynthesis glycosyltransferase n=1 Tax=Yinghuangia sp. YIM S09857 TaxID=3436929 RepID=UPI003F53CB31
MSEPTTPDTTLLVIAKSPSPGRVKTRLTPPLTPEQAADIAEAALADTLDAVRLAPARRRVLVLDGRPRAWFPADIDVVPQCAGGLDVRLAAAFAACTGPTLLIGMDTPQVDPDLLAVDWTLADAWFGAAADGGFWALGLRVPDPALLLGVPMSVPHTGRVQRERLVAAGLRVRDLPVLNDIDTAEDLAEVARDAPHTRTARLAQAYHALAARTTRADVPAATGGPA